MGENKPRSTPIVKIDDIMDPRIEELTENIKMRGRDGARPLYKETGPEFVMPKFPIERKEMEDHILKLRESRATSLLVGDNQFSTPTADQVLYSKLRSSLPAPCEYDKTYNITNGRFSLQPEGSEALSADISGGECLDTNQNSNVPHESPFMDMESSSSSTRLPPSLPKLAFLSAREPTAVAVASPPAVGSLLTTDTLASASSEVLPNLSLDFQRVQISGNVTLDIPVDELYVAAEALFKAIVLRRKYMAMSLQSFNPTVDRYLSALSSGSVDQLESQERAFASVQSPVTDHPFNPPEVSGDPFAITDWPEPIDVKLEFRQGIMHILLPDDKPETKQNHPLASVEFNIPSFATYLADYDMVRTYVADGPLKSFCYRRLTYLGSKFSLHQLLNEARESLEQKRVPHRDFYNIRKVDTHIHAASCMNQKHLLRFIKKTIRTKGNVDVYLDPKTQKPITLCQLIEHTGITPYDLSIDNLDVHADRNTFHRFDKFNAKYNPIGQSQLREVFLKTDNYINGSFFAEVLKQVFSDLEESKYQNSEPRLSIYGRSIKEWDSLAKWAINWQVYSNNVRWLIQVPRLYDVYHAKGSMKCFQDIITNVFQPLFEVTADPKSHPELHAFLQYVTGFDSVDDESKSDRVVFDRSTPTPENYTLPENPPYSYYIFYLYANLSLLNQFRSLRNMNTFSLRPHCGEAGNANHLVTSFLLAESINHGLLLRKAPVLQYLYYLSQIGIAMSPLSNNSLFLDYHRNPLNNYLQRGLFVSLSTDDPLQFHFTKEPLIEEYSIATQVWKLTPTDMCELARNSVLMSGFSHTLKSFWLGPNYKQESVLGNDITRTNVPNIRIAYRHETLTQELRLLLLSALAHRSVHSTSSTMSPSSTRPHSPWKSARTMPDSQ